MWWKALLIWVTVSVMFTFWVWPGIAGMNGEPEDDRIS